MPNFARNLALGITFSVLSVSLIQTVLPANACITKKDGHHKSKMTDKQQPCPLHKKEECRCKGKKPDNAPADAQEKSGESSDAHEHQ